MHDHIIESKALLKEKYDNAKLLGSRVQASKQVRTVFAFPREVCASGVGRLSQAGCT